MILLLLVVVVVVVGKMGVYCILSALLPLP